jgi:aminoglycoside 6'-N-acetyltransferase I
MRIQKAELRDLPALAALACELWPGHRPEEMELEMGSILRKPDAAFFLLLAGETATGFAQCQLRHDYVEGTDSSPVGYLEGIYVAPEYRRRGFAGKLLCACENWAREQGCCEFASDCELTNSDSLRFHLHMGFGEANRIICFTKKL